MFISIREDVSIISLSAQQNLITSIGIVNLKGQINAVISNDTELLISGVYAYAGGMCISPFPISIK